MRPRPALLLGALLAPALPLVAAAPAQAATNIICVNTPTDTGCDRTFSKLSDALGEAKNDGQPSRIKIGPGDYGGADGPYTIDGSTSPLEVVGNGNGTGNQATTIAAPAGADPSVSVDSATLRNLRVEMTGSDGVGVDLTDGAVAEEVFVVNRAPASGSTGIRANGSTVRGSTVNLRVGPGTVGYRLTGGSGTVTRSTVRAAGIGIRPEAGTLAIDNTLVDLGSAAATGLRSEPATATGPVTVNARYLSVVGGTAGSVGVVSSAQVGVTSTVTLVSSVVWGPQTSVVATANNGGSSTLEVHHSDFQSRVENGTGTVSETGGGNLHVDPLFLDPAGDDYSLRAGSPVVDKGDPSVSTGVDRAGRPRANGVPDMGAYELQPAPTTIFTSGPSRFTNNRQPVFQFKSETAKSFECRIDGGGWNAGCASPATVAPLADGTHTFEVRATDAAGSVESPPAARSFTVDTVAPDTIITKKPAKRFFKKRVRFKFATDEPAATFQCNLDGRSWRRCQATFRFNTKVGKHTLLVRAVDAAANVDPTPARYKYKRLQRRR